MKILKYSLSNRQTYEYLSKADEIRVQWRDRTTIIDLIEKYPDALINLTRHFPDCENPIDWKQIEDFSIMCRGRFMLGLTHLDEMKEAHSRNIKFYYLAPAYTFQDLNDYKAVGVCCVYLGAPLFFMMDKVKRFNLPVRVVTNTASSEALRRPDGATGTWIRPEDVELYEPYVDTIEFVGNQSQEQALYRIYAERKEWKAQLNLIVQDINRDCSNHLIPPYFAESRLNCGQKCQENGRCQLCYRVLDLANPEKLKKALDLSKET